MREYEIADRAARQAVRRVFEHLGVNVDDPESMSNLQGNLQFSNLVHNAAKT